MVMKKSGRGSVGRAFAKAKRYKEDKEWREKQERRRKENYYKNRDKNLERSKVWVGKLNEFANKRCIKCNKLLNYRTKSNLCRKHWVEEIKKRWKELGEKGKGISNQRCVKCNKLLSKKTKGNLCLKHFREEVKGLFKDVKEKTRRK